MADINALVDQLSALTVLEAAELSKALEEKWGVSAAAAVAVAGGRLTEQLDVQLEDVGLQRQYAVEHGVAGAKVVNGDANACGAVALHDFTQLLDAALQLGDLKHHLITGNAHFLKQLQAGQWLARLQLADPGGRDVQAEKPFGGVAEAFQRLSADAAVQLQQVFLRRGRVGEQRAGAADIALIVAQARQGFVAGNAASGGVDQGLEVGQWLACKHIILRGRDVGR